MRFKKIILLSFSILSWLLTYSQPVQLKDFSQEKYIFINGFTDYLKTTNPIPLDSILQPRTQEQFVRLENKKVLFIGYDPYYYWYRFSISNKDTLNKDIILLLGGLGIHEADLWQRKNNRSIFSGRSGYQYPFDKRPYPYVHHAFPMTIAAYSTDTFYIRMDESHAYKSTAFVLVEPASMRKFEHRFYFIMGIIIGLLLLFSIFNLYLFISVKEKIHLWYSLYIFAILFFLIKQEGIDAEFLGLDSDQGYRTTYMGAVASLAVGFLLQVVQLFLMNIKPKSFLYKIMLLTKWSSFVTAIIQFIVFYVRPDYKIERFVFEWSNKTALLAFMLILISCIYSFYKGFKPALFILIGQSLFIIGGISRALFIGTESYIFPPSLFETGLVAEVVIISFGLMYRYNLYKKEKEQLTFQLQEQKINAAQEILFAQEQEQKRIAEDLHDELGGNLAAIKMTLQTLDLPGEQSDALTGLIDKASTNARNISHNLMPPEFIETRLDDLLRNYYTRLNTEGTIKFHFHYSGIDEKFNKKDELMIYRIIMELTSNIIRHSKATDATIHLVYHEKQLAIMSEDNGKGFISDTQTGIGLKNIRSRVNYLNGTMNIDSGMHGTTVMFHIPYKKQQDE